MTKQYRLSEMSDEDLRRDILMHGPEWWWKSRCWLAEVLVGRRRFNANREIWARRRGAVRVEQKAERPKSPPPPPAEDRPGIGTRGERPQRPRPDTPV